MREITDTLQNQREDIFLFAPPHFPPGQDCFKQFPNPRPEGLDLSWCYLGGMVTSKIEPWIKQGSILINTCSPLFPNLDQEKIEFHLLFVESPVFFFLHESPCNFLLSLVGRSAFALSTYLFVVCCHFICVAVHTKIFGECRD